MPTLGAFGRGASCACCRRAVEAAVIGITGVAVLDEDSIETGARLACTFVAMRRGRAAPSAKSGVATAFTIASCGSWQSMRAAAIGLLPLLIVD